MRESSYSHLDVDPQYWFNLKTLKVEVGPRDKAENRVGPFATEAEAKNALSLLRQRAQQWTKDEESE